VTDVELSRRRRMTVLAICCMSIFVVSLDNTVVNVALPSIRRDLGASVSQLQWTVDAYTVVLASLLVLSGSIADRLGRARIFQVGLVLFTIGSLLCSAAPNASWLIAFRMVQAVGGSMLNPVAMSIIRNTFRDPRERAQAIGIWGGVVGLSMALGPLLGGVLIAAADWRAIFWVNVPVGLLAVVLVRRFVPESRAPTARGVDLVGQGLVIVGLGALTYAIIEAGTAGAASPRVLACAVAAAASLVGFVAYELRREDPLIDPRFFRSIPFSGAALVAVLAFTALGGFLFLTQLYLQGDRGLSALHAGLYTLPMAAAAFVAAPLSGRLVGRRGGRISMVAGGAGLAIGSVMLTGLTPTTATGWLLTAYLVFGLGFGMVNPPITNTAVSGMPGAQAGVAAAIASTSRLVGISLGVAVSGAIVVSGSSIAATSVAQASHPAWWINAVCGAAVVVLGFASTGARALRSARAAVVEARGTRAAPDRREVPAAATAARH
jgi:EmrB/QacA subfamily drug resistance transporter